MNYFVKEIRLLSQASFVKILKPRLIKATLPLHRL